MALLHNNNNNHLVVAVAVLLISSSPSTVDAEELRRENVTQALEATSFYDVLRLNGLPMGVFPRGISDFSIDEATGAFRLLLQSPSPCDAVFETRLRYNREVTGRISYGKISDVRGVSVQELFLWLPVKGIQVDIPSSGLIYFDVDVVSKQFSLSLFETPKGCHPVGDHGEENVGQGTKNDVVLSAVGDHDRLPISENPSEKFTRKRIMDH